MPVGVAVKYTGSCSSAVNGEAPPEWHYRVRNTFIEVRPESGPARQSSCPNLLMLQGASDGTATEKKRKPIAIKLEDHIEKSTEAQPFSLFTSFWPSPVGGQETPNGSLAFETSSKGTEDDEICDSDSPDACEGCSLLEPFSEQTEPEIVTPRTSTLRCSQKDCDMTPPQPSKSEFINFELLKVDSPRDRRPMCKEHPQCPEHSRQTMWNDQSAHAYSFSALSETSESWGQTCFFEESHGGDIYGNPILESGYSISPWPAYPISLEATLSHTTSEHLNTDSYAPFAVMSPKQGFHHHHAAQSSKARQKFPIKPVSILLRRLPPRISEQEVQLILDKASHLLGDSPCVRLLKDEHGECVGAAEVILAGRPDAVRIAKEVKKTLHRTTHAGRLIDVVLPGVGAIAPLPQ